MLRLKKYKNKKKISYSVKKEINIYYSTIDEEYEKLSNDGKKVVEKISAYKKILLVKKVRDKKGKRWKKENY